MERRNTRQRQIILDAVKARCDHPTAEQIYDDVHKMDENISLGTVYRNLAVLSSDNEIKDIKLSSGNRYDLRTDNHNHFICEKCSKVFDIDVDYDRSFDNKNTKEGFKIYSHQTVFIGLCPKCQKTEKGD